MFSLPSPFFFLFMRGLNFRPGGRGPFAPVLLREGGVGNLSHRIKGSSAEEVQARSHPRLLAGWEEPPPAGTAALGSSQVTNVRAAARRGGGF